VVKVLKQGASSQSSGEKATQSAKREGAGSGESDPAAEQARLEARITVLGNEATSQLTELSGHLEDRITAHERHVSSAESFVRREHALTVRNLETARQRTLDALSYAEEQVRALVYVATILAIIGLVLIGVLLETDAPAFWSSYWLEFALLGGGVILGFVWLSRWLSSDQETRTRDALNYVDYAIQEIASSAVDVPRLGANKDHTKSIVNRTSTLIDGMLTEVKRFLPGMAAVVESVEDRNRRDRFRSEIRYVTSRFGFRLTPEFESTLASFRSALSTEEDWLTGVSALLAPQLDVSTRVFRLMFYEATGRQGQLRATWAACRESDKDVQTLAKSLVQNHVVRTSPVDEASAVRELVLVLGEIHDAFSIEEVTRAIARFEHAKTVLIDHLEEVIAQCNLPGAIVTKLLTFVPPTIQSLDSEALKVAAEEAQISPAVMGLFYNGTFRDGRAEKALQSLRGTPAVRDVAQFLMNQDPTLRNLQVEDVGGILETQSTFDLATTPSKLRVFAEFVGFTRDLTDFLADEGIPLRELEVGCLHRESPVTVQGHLAEKLSRAFRASIDRERLCESIHIATVSPQLIEGLGLASVALFLVDRASTTTDERLFACRDAASNPLSLRTLYEWAALHDELRDTPDRATIAKAFVRSLVPLGELPHFEEVRVRLLEGAVPPRLSDFATARMDALKRRFEELGAKVEEGMSIGDVLENLSTSVKRFFEASVRVDVVPQFLRDQVVQAYLITSPSDVPLIRTLESEQFERAVNTLAQSDSRYRRFLISSKGSGKATRIGVLPPGVSFQDFVEMLRTALRKAKEEETGMIGGAGQLAESVHVMRISPSKNAMQTIYPPGYVGPTPDSVILDLMTDELNAKEKVTILSAVDSTRPTNFALREVVEGVLNQEESSLIAMAERQIQPVLTACPSLLKREMSRAIDRQMLAAFGCASLVELCKSVARLVETSGSAGAGRVFRQHLRAAIPKSVVSSDGDFQMLSSSCFSVVKSVGTTLTV
jgi:DNA-directed RNA polymerase subunit K/omega